MPVISSAVSKESSLSASTRRQRPTIISPRMSLPPNRLGSIVDLSSAGRKAALGEDGKPKVTNAPMLRSGRLEHLPIRELINRYNFESVTAIDLGVLAKELYLRKEISAEATNGLIQVALAVSVPGHPDKLIDFVGHVDKRTRETARRLPSDPYSKPESSIPHYRHAKRALDDLTSFVDSGRDRLSTKLLARWPVQSH